MAAYWVTQNKTFTAESAGGYLWAPLRDRAGAERRSHVILADMRAGDLVLSYVGRRIIAIGYVLDQPVLAPKPKDLDDVGLWQEDGWLVQVRFTELAETLPILPLADRLLSVLPSQYGPLNRDGTGAQGYAYYLPPKAEALLLKALGLGVVERAVEDHMVMAIPDLTTRETVIEARVGQGRFRDDVLRTWGQRCAVTRMAIRKLLRASHIKPWRVANHAERLDPQNGLALSPNYDAAFDQGIVSFSDTGRVLISGQASRWDIEKLGFRSDHGLAHVHDRHRTYLQHHREAFGFETG